MSCVSIMKLMFGPQLVGNISWKRRGRVMSWVLDLARQRLCTSQYSAQLKADFSWDVQCGAPPPPPPLLCPQPCFSATFSNGVETDFSPLLPERWAESISVDGLVSKNELLTTKRSFHTSPEYTVTPPCLLTACLPACPSCLPLPYRRSHTYIEASWAKLYALCLYVK